MLLSGFLGKSLVQPGKIVVRKNMVFEWYINAPVKCIHCSWTNITTSFMIYLCSFWTTDVNKTILNQLLHCIQMKDTSSWRLSESFLVTIAFFELFSCFTDQDVVNSWCFWTPFFKCANRNPSERPYFWRLLRAHVKSSQLFQISCSPISPRKRQNKVLKCEDMWRYV